MPKFIKIYSQQIIWGAVTLLISINFLIWSDVFGRRNQADIEVSFFDVGQGDSIFLKSKDGADILIDGGPNNKVISLLARSLPFYDRSIDVVLLTHPHSDHVTGLIDVLKQYHVGMVLESGADYNTPEAKEFERIIKEKNIKRVVIDRPASLSFSDGALLKILLPGESFENKILKNVHDSMVVSELDYENKKILFMGDAEKKLEQKLISEDKIGNTDILKIGHHGSKTSSTQNFIDVVRPKYAIISVGRNKFGHPNQEVLSRLLNFGVKTFRTDMSGTIRAKITNGVLTLKSEK